MILVVGENDYVRMRSPKEFEKHHCVASLRNLSHGFEAIIDNLERENMRHCKDHHVMFC